MVLKEGVLSKSNMSLLSENKGQGIVRKLPTRLNKGYNKKTKRTILWKSLSENKDSEVHLQGKGTKKS